MAGPVAAAYPASGSTSTSATRPPSTTPPCGPRGCRRSTAAPSSRSPTRRSDAGWGARQPEARDRLHPGASPRDGDRAPAGAARGGHDDVVGPVDVGGEVPHAPGPSRPRGHGEVEDGDHAVLRGPGLVGHQVPLAEHHGLAVHEPDWLHDVGVLADDGGHGGRARENAGQTPLRGRRRVPVLGAPVHVDDDGPRPGAAGAAGGRQDGARVGERHRPRVRRSDAVRVLGGRDDPDHDPPRPPRGRGGPGAAASSCRCDGPRPRPGRPGWRRRRADRSRGCGSRPCCRRRSRPSGSRRPARSGRGNAGSRSEARGRGGARDGRARGRPGG